MKSKIQKLLLTNKHTVSVLNCVYQILVTEAKVSDVIEHYTITSDHVIEIANPRDLIEERYF